LFAKSRIEREMNTASDNPLIFLEGDEIAVLSGGNFHGEYPAKALDVMVLYVAEIG